MKTSFHVACVAIAITVAGGAIAQSAGNYDLHWNLPAVGGAAMSGGASYTLTGSVGQHDVNPTGAMTGTSSYALRGGFWAGVHENDVIFRDSFEGR